MALEPLRRIYTGMLPVAVLIVLVLISLHLMSNAVQNREELSRLFTPLLVASILGLVSLVILVGINVTQLAIRYRRQAIGSRLTLRMVVVFVALSLTPVAVVYYYSQQFLIQGIDSWFDVQIDSAMDDALSLSRASLDLHKRERLKTTQRILSSLEGSSLAALSLELEEMRETNGASELAFLEPSGRVFTITHADPTVLVPDEPDSAVLQQVRAGEDYVGLSPRDSDGYLEVRVVLMDPARGKILQAIYPTSGNITNLTGTVEKAYHRYKELTFLRNSLKNTFTLTLAMVLLFSLLSAIWAAFLSARRLVAPITGIAEGTRAVTKGDYDMQLPMPKSRDELSFLVASFNAMTRRISRARDQAANSQRQVESQRAYLETVLRRLSSGVMTLDSDGVVQTANRSAHDILRVEQGSIAGLMLSEMGRETPQTQQFVAAVCSHIEHDAQEWRDEISLYGADGRQVLLCRGTPLAEPEGEAAGYVLVFDDITALIKAQRDAAWGEVARRLAHEIKNPLTPIQLSAERLRHKYLKTMPERDARVLDRSTHTIVQQVEALKEMVNDFSDYASPPKLKRTPVQFDGLVSAVVDLYRSAGTKPDLGVALNARDAAIEADPVRIRQVIHNLIKNAQEAVQEVPNARIEVSTSVTEQAECGFVEFRVADNGPGFDNELLAHLFEPYVTTKTHGTGIGLAIVKKIVEEHGGMVSAENMATLGACVTLKLPVHKNIKLTPEIADDRTRLVNGEKIDE